MDEKRLLELMVQTRRMGNLLDDVLDLSRQMAEAVDRGDEVSTRMLMAMRAEPLTSLVEADQLLRLLIMQIPEEADKAHYRSILNGGKSDLPQDERLMEQCEANRRRYAQVLELDRRISQKLAGERSVYLQK